MKIIRPAVGASEAKVIDIRDVTRDGVRFKRGVFFTLNLSPAYTSPSDDREQGWEVWKVIIAIWYKGEEKLVEMDDCLNLEALPTFAVTSDLLNSGGLASAVSHAATRFACLKVEEDGDEIILNLDIGKYHSEKWVPEKVLSPMIVLED